MSTETALVSLLERMNEGGDFPALSHTISELNKAVDNETSHSSVLTEIILRDVSLTNKLLRLVNAAHYGSFGGQPISTISRAVVILGLDAVRDAAVSLLLFEHLENHAQADELMAEAVDSFFCGTLGRMLAASAGVRDGEEAFISALFRNLGRLMARFHFYEETVRVAEVMEEEKVSESMAARQVLGVDYDQLGLAIARQWHFSPGILHAITPMGAEQPRGGVTGHGRLQVVANLAQELHQTYARNLPPDQQRQAINALCERFREVAKVSPESLAETVHKAAEAGAEQAVGETDPTSILAQGMQDLTSLILGEYQLSDVLKLVVEIFYRSGSFDRALVSTLDRGSQCLVGRVAFGPQAETLRHAFRIPLSFTPDVFHAALSKGQDILISDTTADNIRNRIPSWYAQNAGAHAFLLLPIVINGKSVAMLYADRQTGPMALPGQLLGLLKALRNQATLAIRQKL
jgi:HD-like signal output (HDOD) protein